VQSAASNFGSSAFQLLLGDGPDLPAAACLRGRQGGLDRGRRCKALAEVHRLVTRVRLTQPAGAGQSASAKLLLAQALAHLRSLPAVGRAGLCSSIWESGGEKKPGAIVAHPFRDEEIRPKKQNALALPGRTFLQG